MIYDWKYKSAINYKPLLAKWLRPFAHKFCCCSVIARIFYTTIAIVAATTNFTQQQINLPPPKLRERH